VNQTEQGFGLHADAVFEEGSRGKVESYGQQLKGVG